MNITCPTSITCPGSDFPILNISSEDPDQFFFWNYTYFIDPPPNCLTCNPNEFYARDCFGVQYSALSQADADLLARLHSVECSNGTGPSPAGTCVNEPQTARVLCSNGEQVFFTAPAGMFAAPNTGDEAACLANVNAQAMAYAEQQASLLAQTDCPKTLCSFTTDATLPSATIGNPYSTQLVAAISGSPVIFSVVSGSLPTGLAMNSSGTITGTPTVSGTYQFSVQALTAVTSCTRQFHLTVPATLLAYYKLDETTANLNLLHDAAGAYDLTAAFFPSGDVSVAGKIGTALSGPNGGWSTQTWNNWTDRWYLDEFTVRFWFYWDGTPYTSTASHLLLTGSHFHSGKQWYIQVFGSGGKPYFEFTLESSSGTGLIDGHTLAAGWNYVAFWFKGGEETGVTIEYPDGLGGYLGSTAIQPVSFHADLTGPGHYEGLHLTDDVLSSEPGITHFAIDELALWGRKLSSAELTDDFNGGTGRTYPNVP